MRPLLRLLAPLVAISLASLSARAEPPMPAFARGRGALAVSGDGRFGLFASGRELAVWELASGKRRHRARLSNAPWALYPSPNGETTALHAPGRLAEVQLLTGRVVVDLAAPSTIIGDAAVEIAWAPEGDELLLCGLELDELEAGVGTPIAYFEPKLGYVARQIRIPGLVETRGMAVLPDGAGVVVGTPRHLLYLGRSLIDVRTSQHSGAPDLQVVSALDSGVVVIQGGRVEVLDPKAGTVLRSLDLTITPAEQLMSRPLGRWLGVLADKATALRVIDLARGSETSFALVTLGKPRTIVPLADAIVALGRQIVVTPLGP